MSELQHAVAASAANSVPDTEAAGAAIVIPGNELRRLVYNEVVNMLYRQLPVSITGSMVGVFIMIAALWRQIPTHWLLIWLVLMSLNQGSRLCLYFVFRRGRLQRYRIRWRARIWATGSAISGLIWGSTAVFFFTPESAIHQAIPLIIVFGATTAAVPLIASHMPSLYVFILPALVPFVMRHLEVWDTAHIELGLTLLVVTLGLLSFGRNYNRLIVNSLRDRFENEALAGRFAKQNSELEQARNIAEQANRAKTQFFAAASHDLRQPLHAMSLFASALREKARDPEVVGIVSSMNASVQALETLFNELLDISKLDSGVIKPNIEDFALDEVFGRLSREFETEAAAKGLTLSVRGGGYFVKSDPLLLERIVRNLVSNSIRYTAEGEINVSAAPTDGRVRIEVRDTGIGIRAEDRERIFEEFFQLGNPARTSKKGLGLGLSIVQRLCALLDHRIDVTSKVGKGTTFSVEVPIGDAGIAASSALAEAPRQNPDLHGKLIVVIDDERAIVEGMQVLLSGWGARVLGSSNGEDVVAAVHEAGILPDLLIVDHRLGIGSNGIEVAQRIRQELDPEIPAILVTGSITPELAEHAHAADFDFLLKPVNAVQLRERIGIALNLQLAPPIP